jgi:arginyl-tRNA synthetase
MGSSYGSSDLGHAERVQVEFGSTNPTGPLHVGHGRGYILGDALATLLAFTGHSVEREFYVNDQNTQAIKFGQSILARYRGDEPPEGGYLGDYVRELAERARQQGVPAVEEELRRFGIQTVVSSFEQELLRLGVRYD